MPTVFMVKLYEYGVVGKQLPGRM